ncbi:transposase [Vairimorpha ceranae]|uniref:Transposase n=1 Tax=Vairimorpha ceranae TaxID=40302 RepID=A0A0F9YRL1_9MICR|nr:transposase [Vairimorpha ceranae]KKO75212.1 transposase [Vairimorpha ceranae]
MVWTCFSYYGVGKLLFIEGKMNSIKYISILTDNLDAFAEMMGLPECFFQQDNNLKHTANITKQWFAANNGMLSAWPSKSQI